MNQVLKRHPLALRYIRYQLTERLKEESDSDNESEQNSQSESNELESTVRSYNLQSSRMSRHERYLERLPVDHFLPRSDAQ